MRPLVFLFRDIPHPGSILACFFLAMLLAGCIGRTENVAPAYTLGEGSGNGLLVGSVTYHGKQAAHMVYFKQLDDDSPLWVQAGETAPLPVSSRVYFGDLAIEGDLFAVELPAGRYAFDSWEVNTGYTQVAPDYEMAIPFEIKPGQALYIGNFHFRTSFFGSGLTGAEFQYGDFLARDLNILRKHYPEVDPRRVYTGIKKGLIVKDGGGNSLNIQIPLYVPAF